MIIYSDYTVTDKNLEEARGITEVRGFLHITEPDASLPVLESVGGWLIINADDVSLPALMVIKDVLHITGAKVSLPALKSVGGMSWEQPTPEQARARLEAVARAALAHDDALEMDEYHSCNTSHCVAGWSIDQAGAHGRALESAMGSCGAGLALLGLDMAPHFFTGNEAARDFLAKALELNDDH